jgi:hypothetical protein
MNCGSFTLTFILWEQRILNVPVNSFMTYMPTVLAKTDYSTIQNALK